MDERTAFAVLEIEMTKDENLIKQAYRKLLTKTNPEDNPEGFKRLRTAYEMACAFCRRQEEEQEEEEKSPADLWVERVKEVYESFSRRICVSEWEALLEEDICQDLDAAEEIRQKLFQYLMDHYRLPKKVWQLLDERFFIEEEKQQFIEQYPRNFVEYMIDQKNIVAEFPYTLFQGADDADYDTFINQYFELYDAVQEKNFDLAKSLLDTLEHTGIYHPLVEMEEMYLNLSDENREKTCERLRTIMEIYPEEVRLEIPAATLFWNAGKKEEAAKYYEKILEDIPGHYMANRQLFTYYKETGEYEKAKKRGEEIMRNHSSDQEMQEQIKEINEILMEKYRQSIEKKELDGQGYIDFAWCCLQNEKYQEGIETLLSIEPDEEHSTGYYSVMERLYLSDRQPQKAEEMGYLWIQAIRREEPSLSEEEKKNVPERIAAAYYLMGRGWMQEEGYEDHALACMNQSIELFDDNEDSYLQKAQILMKLHREDEAMEACNHVLIKNENNFWAYVYRMDICFEQKNGQGVIDNYNRAREIFAYYPHLYETAADIFEKYGQYQDALEVVEKAKELEITTPRLQYFKVRCRHMLADTGEELEKVAQEIAEVLKEIQEQGQWKEAADILAEGARCMGDLKEPKEALQYINKALEICREPLYYWVRSSVMMDLENYEDALKDLEICEKAFPDGDRVFSRIGICHYQLRRLDEAMVYYKKTLQINDTNERVNSDILDIYKIRLENSLNLEERDAVYREGLPYANRQIEIRPEAYFYIERGLFHLEAGACAKAIEDFQQAAQLEPENVYAYHNMGSAYEKMRQYEKAVAFYEKALSVKLPEQRLVTRGKLARCLKIMGRYEEAAKCLLKHQEEFPNARKVMEELVDLYSCMKKPELAIPWIKQYCNKNQAEITLEKVKMYMSLEEGREAEIYLKELLKIDYKAARVQFFMGQNYLYILDNRRAALKAAKKAMALEKKAMDKGEANHFGEAAVLLEEIYYRMGKLRKAAAIGKELREYLTKKYGTEEEMQKYIHRTWCLYSIGESYYYQGEYEKAEEYFKKMPAAGRCISCNTGRCLDYLQACALLCEAKGYTEQALYYFQESLKENPLDLQGLYGRKRLRK